MMQEAQLGYCCVSSSRQVGLVTERVPSCNRTVLPVWVQLQRFPSVGCLDISGAGICGDAKERVVVQSMARHALWPSCSWFSCGSDPGVSSKGLPRRLLHGQLNWSKL